MDQKPVYHLRRMDRDMPDRAEQLAVLRGQKLLTLAMCRDNQPYLVTLDYAFCDEENCFYIHCATDGKKTDFLLANPRVCGQVTQDDGYLVGQCSHAYRSVVFEASAEFVTDPQQKRKVLEFMVEHFEANPEPLKQKLLAKATLDNVAVLRLRVESMTGKKSKGSSVWQ